MAPLIERWEDFRGLLSEDPDPAAMMALRAQETTGRPLGSPAFIAALEKRLARPLAPRRRGRKPKQRNENR